MTRARSASILVCLLGARLCGHAVKLARLTPAQSPSPVSSSAQHRSSTSDHRRPPHFSSASRQVAPRATCRHSLGPEKYFQFSKNIFAASTQIDLPEVSLYWLSEKGDVKISPGLRAVLQIGHIAIHTTCQLSPVWMQPAFPTRTVSGDAKIIINNKQNLKKAVIHLENNQLLSSVPGRKQSQ